MIKVISLDIGGSLIDISDNLSSKSSFKELSKLVKMPYDDVKLAYKSIFQKTRGTRSELINNFCNMLKINNSIQLDNFFKKKFKKEKNIISNDKLNVINKLKKMGHKIILFSNNCCLLEDYFDEYYGLFDKIFYSFDIILKLFF